MFTRTEERRIDGKLAKFAVINATSSGNNNLVSAVAGLRIRVLDMFLVSDTAVSLRFDSNPGGTAITGSLPIDLKGGFVLPFNPVGWFETARGQSLSLNLSLQANVGGALTYIEIY